MHEGILGRTKGAALSILAVAALALGGCRPEPTELEPAATAGTGAGAEAPTSQPEAGGENEDIRLTAHADGWEGWRAIQRRVTPLRVTLHNDSERAIVLRYDAFAVRGHLDTYAVVPPYRMEGDVDTYVATADFDPVGPPGLAGHGFSIAPPYAGVYPSATVADGYAWDAAYYGGYDGFWTDVELPTEQMLERVLPEGIVGPGGYVDGVLFFEHVPREETGLILFAELESTGADAPVARFEIPLVVEDEG